jgi:hypothetical protein
MVKPTAMSREAEFIAASEEAKGLLWLKRLLGELGGNSSVVPTYIYKHCAVDLTMFGCCYCSAVHDSDTGVKCVLWMRHAV